MCRSQVLKGKEDQKKRITHTLSINFLLILLSFTGPGGACRLLDLSLVNLMFGAPGHDRGVGDDAVLNE